MWCLHLINHAQLDGSQRQRPEKSDELAHDGRRAHEGNSPMTVGRCTVATTRPTIDASMIADAGDRT
jgi:hypothetical protein